MNYEGPQITWVEQSKLLKMNLKKNWSSLR